MDTPPAFAKGASMPQTRPPYAPGFRRQMVDLVRTGRDPADLAREFEPSAQAIRNGVVQADRQEDRREGESLRRPTRPWLRRSVMNWLGYDARTSRSGWSATFSLEPRPGLPAKPARSRRGFRFMSANQAIVPLSARARVRRTKAVQPS